MTHEELIRRAESWLLSSAQVPGYREGVMRRVKCGVVLTEYSSSIDETPDAIGWFAGGRQSILIECKATRSDFRADRNKYFRGDHGTKFGLGMFRYYFTNPGIAKREELPPNWGLLEVHGHRVACPVLATAQERSLAYEACLLWSECRKIHVVEQGGTLLKTRQVSRVMARYSMTAAAELARLRAEVECLHNFVLQMAERLYLAAECLARNAERRRPGKDQWRQDRRG